MTKRPLTPTEIDELVDIAIPYNSHGNFFECDRLAVEQLRNNVRLQLRGIRIYPQGILELQQVISKRYLSRLIQPGIMVGKLTAEAVSQHITQETMNGKHSLGKSDLLNIIDTFQRILNASKYENANLRNEVSYLYFNNPKLGIDNIDELLLDVYSQVVSLKISDITLSEEVFKIDDIDIEEQGDMVELNLARSIPENSYVAKITIDAKLLYQHRVNIETLVNQLRQDGVSVILSTPHYDNDQLVMALYIYYNTHSSQNHQLLTSHALPQAAKVQIAGINNIRSMDFDPVKIQRVFLADTYDQGLWYLAISTDGLLNYGFTVEQIYRYIEQRLSATIQHDASDSQIIGFQWSSQQWYDKHYNGTKPSDMDEQVTPLSALRYMIRRNDKGATKYRGITKGTNLATVSQLLSIDPYHSYSTSIREMDHLFGIENARNTIVRLLHDVITRSGGSVDSRHYELLADYMTAMGYIVKVDYHGMSTRDVGFLSKLSFERQLQTIKSDVIMGVEDTTKDISASVMLGQPGNFGEGYQELGMKVNQKMKRQIVSQRVTPRTPIATNIIEKPANRKVSLPSSIIRKPPTRSSIKDTVVLEVDKETKPVVLNNAISEIISNSLSNKKYTIGSRPNKQLSVNRVEMVDYPTVSGPLTYSKEQRSTILELIKHGWNVRDSYIENANEALSSRTQIVPKTKIIKPSQRVHHQVREVNIDAVLSLIPLVNAVIA